MGYGSHRYIVEIEILNNYSIIKSKAIKMKHISRTFDNVHLSIPLSLPLVFFSASTVSGISLQNHSEQSLNQHRSMNFCVEFY